MMIKKRIEAIIKALSLRVQVRESGFSMMELIAVITVLSILLAIAVPAFSDWRERAAMSNLYGTLMAHMKQGRVKAMAENRDVLVQFDPALFNLAAVPQPALNVGKAYVFDALPVGSLRSTPHLEEERLVNVSDFSPSITILKSPANVAAGFSMNFKGVGTVANAAIILKSDNASVVSRKITINLLGRAYDSTYLP